ncbi:30S ribosomal protein S16 [Ureaplasma ceti]|uniref:Small ribosomal subunit protein bS16 n=1 Tax=Ureaplasma ceti TaxID=3119530 RepID=A0ABP9U9A5_9BACT
MVKIRLLRIGRHKSPTYRIVVADSKAKANGAYIELLGQYNPLKGEKSLKTEAIIKWLNAGAQPTDTVKSFLKQEKIWAEFAKSKQAKASSKTDSKNESK